MNDRMGDNCQFEVNLRRISDQGGQISAAGLSPDIEVRVPLGRDNVQAGLWSAEHLLLGAVATDFIAEFVTLAQKNRD